MSDRYPADSRSRRNIVTLCVLLAALTGLYSGPTAPATPADDGPELLEVKKIWDRAPHNAFTDLVRFDGRWLCCFREGEGHVSPDGNIRIITSPDGEKWTSTALLSVEDRDLRDAKVSVTPDGNLMLTTAASWQEDGERHIRSMTWFSRDGKTWNGPWRVGDRDVWLWRVTWHNGRAYGVGYGCGDKRFIRLYRSHCGRRFDTVAPTIFDKGYPNETKLMFRFTGRCLCLLRHEGEEAKLGSSMPPYTDWSWEGLGTYLGGPNMIQIPDGRIVAAGRVLDPTRTALLWLDTGENRLERFLTLPSGGDTSYPGLAWHDGVLWVSYYSSHEEKTSIYLAKVDIPLE